MLRKALTTILLTLATPAFAENSSETFLEELEALVELQATDVLQQSVRDYYAKNSDIEQGKYPTLLHDAAIMGSLKLLKYLIKHDSHNLDYAYENGPTPLGYIAGDNQTAAAKILLNAGANSNDMGNTDSVSPLSSAVTSGNMKMIQILLKHDAEVHIGAYYQSPLGLTLEKNDIETLQLFDTYGFQLDSMNDELRIIITEYLNSDFVEEEVLRILKIHGFDIYAKTEEKASFFTEYGKKIEHSDVRQMLQDIYKMTTETKMTEAEETPVTTAKETLSIEVEKPSDNEAVETTSAIKGDIVTDQATDIQEEQKTLPKVNKRVETETNIAEASEDLDNKDNIVENTETAKIVETTENNTEVNTTDEVTSDTDTGEASSSNFVPTNNQNINSTKN